MGNRKHRSHVPPVAGEGPRVSGLTRSHAAPQKGGKENAQGQGREGQHHLRTTHPARKLSTSPVLHHKAPQLPHRGAAIIGFYRQGN